MLHPKTLRRTLYTATCAALLLGCSGTPSNGPGDPERLAMGSELPVDEPVRGVLTDTTPRYGARGAFHPYYFVALAGERYSVALESEDFDSYLTIGDRAVGLFDPFEQDDDGGDGLDAHIRFTAPRTGTYLALAQALGPHEYGNYTLTLRHLGEPRPVVATPVATGTTTRGELRYDDPVLEDDDASYDLYTVPVRAGRRYAVTLRSDDFDTYLQAGPMRGGEIRVVREDDDGADGTDSRLIVTPSTTGDYGIRATAYGSGLGSYTLRIDTLPEPGPLEPRPLTLGETVEGELSLSDHLLDDGTYFDLYSFQGAANEDVVISLASEDFDAYLALGRLDDGEFDALATDDDGGDGLDSELRYRLPEAGEYVIRAEALGTGETGRYRIRLQRP